MKKIFGLAVIALAVAAPAAQAAGPDSGSYLVRARALRLNSDNGGSTTPDLKLSVNDKTFLEVDFSYFFTPNWATELVLTYPQKHTLYADGAKIATLKHLPPTLLAQYHLTAIPGFRPYAGIGLNYTNFSDVEWTPAARSAYNPNVSRSSYGLALQVGADIPLGGGWSLNLDVKKVKIATDVSSNGTKIGEFKIDPMLYSIGAGYRF